MQPPEYQPRVALSHGLKADSLYPPMRLNRQTGITVDSLGELGCNNSALYHSFSGRLYRDGRQRQRRLHALQAHPTPILLVGIHAERYPTSIVAQVWLATHLQQIPLHPHAYKRRLQMPYERAAAIGELWPPTELLR